VLQGSLDIGELGAKRLEEALRIGLATGKTYHWLSMGRATATVPASSLRRIVLGIASLPDGYEAAVNVLAMRFHGSAESGTTIDEDLLECGRELLIRCPFSEPGSMIDYHLGRIAGFCLKEEDGAKATVYICRQLKAVLAEYRAYRLYYPGLIKGLLRTQPMIVLDELLAGESGDVSHLRIFDTDRRNPIMEIPPETLIQWAQVNPKARFSLLASVITPFIEDKEKKQLIWAPIASRILSLAPDRRAVLDTFRAQLRPTEWNADAVESRRALTRALFSDPDPLVIEWALKEDAELASLAEKLRLQERRTDESFE